MSVSSIAISLLIILFVGIGLVVLLTLRRQRLAGERLRQRQAEFTRRQERAVWAGAVVVGMTAGGLQHSTYGQVAVHLRLKVQPQGSEAYLAATTWLVDLPAVSGLQPGVELSVKIDPEDPRIIYPNLNWAKYSP